MVRGVVILNMMGFSLAVFKHTKIEVAHRGIAGCYSLLT